MATSQIALPADVCDTAYATDGYASSVDTFAGVSLDSDMVFSDGYTAELATVTGDPDGGYTIALIVGV